METPASAVFWIGVDKIKPNPLQPRAEFDEDKLRSLADSIRQYGVLQPLVVTRQEVARDDGGLTVEYQLIAGERRWRAARLAGVMQVPAMIKDDAEGDRVKLEIAIIENLQREDLNPVERAQAFHRLVDGFRLKHHEVAKKIGKSRVYVSNSLRLLDLPPEMIDALSAGQITEGHTRPILMLADRPEEQRTLFEEIRVKRLTVREAESIARRIAVERVRKRDNLIEPEIIEWENELTEKLGTRVQVERREVGGKVTIDFFSNDDLHKILEILNTESRSPGGQEELAEDDEVDLYNIKNFTI